MIKTSIKSIAGEHIQTGYTLITVGEGKGIFTKITVVVDVVDGVIKFSDEQMEVIIKSIKVDNMISANGSFIKRVLKINNEFKLTELLYLKKYELSSILTSDVQYAILAKESGAPEYSNETNLVCLEEYEYVLT